MHISPYEHGNIFNKDPLRDRKLLLTKKELAKLQRGLQDKGFTIVPTLLFINERGLAKVKIGLAKGKKQYDKRQSLKDKDDKLSMARAKQYNY